MANLATAYVQIVPSMKGVGANISNAMGGADIQAAGGTAGNTIVGGLKKVIAGAAIGKALGDTLTQGAALEQSLGGIETLFKGSADKVKENAAVAFREAGISANSYMENVTSFSASLISSLGGDTEAAANLANTAMIDMSDNANKMGTDIESIQQTYQSLARGNFAMLDNLKLGYGGTKSEMERLMTDAEKLTGEHYTVGDFADTVSAIHAIQGSLDITGTTAKEASTTLAGSFGAMKAAASDLMGNLTIGGDVTGSWNNLIDTAKNFAFGNLLPAIGQIGEGLYQLLDQVPGLTTALKILLPVIGGVVLAFEAMKFASFASSIMSAITAAGGLSGVLTILKSRILATNAAVMANPAMLIVGLIALVVGAIATLYATNESFRSKVNEVFSNIKEAVMPILTEIVNFVQTTILPIFSTVFGVVKTVIEAAFGAIGEYWTNVVSPAFSALGNFLTTVLFPAFSVVFGAIGTLVGTVFNFIKTVWDSVLGPVLKAIVQFVGTVFKTAFTLNFEAIKLVVTTVFSAIKSVWEGVLKPAFDAIKTAVGTVKDKVTTVLDGVKLKFETIFNGIKTFLSPIIDWLKKVFDFKWELPKIKLPHFKIDGEFSLTPPSTPSFSIDWYKTGGIFNKASVIGVGEAGSEAVLPLDNFYRYMDGKMASRNDGNVTNINIEMIINAAQGQDAKQIADEVTRKIYDSIARKKAVFA